VTHILRGDVAAALGVAVDTLPPGDLPLERLAALYAQWLAVAAQDGDAPDLVWTFDLVDWLIAHRPELALDAVLASLDLCTQPEQVAVLAAGPAEDLIRLHGPTLIARLTQAAAQSARVRYLLSGVWQGDTPPLLWASIVAARGAGPSLDRDDPLPPPSDTA
jgi:hypothetical protein